MQFLVIFAAAFGVAIAAPQGFLQNTPEVEAATRNFINEYNRLAQLAAAAPDIHIYDSNTIPNSVNFPTSRHTKPAVNPLQGLDVYSFSANLGGNQQFQPHQIRKFNHIAHPVVRTVPQVQQQRTFVQRPVFQPRAQIQEVPIKRWTGPLADTVPAGVNGLPTQVTATPEVEAARNAHFAVLVDAYQRAAATRQG